MKQEFEKHSHRRYNILTGEWVLVSPHRTKRPWMGQEDELIPEKKEAYDKNCYLCPTNQRANGKVNPDYNSTFVFENDFAALEYNTPGFSFREGLLRSESETGICKVVCYTPDHSKTLASLTVDEIEKIIEVWQREFAQLGKMDDINYIQIFENKGAMMGASNPHPHGQIWAQKTLPNEVVKKDYNQKKYFDKTGHKLLEDYVNQELERDERIVFRNDNFVVLVPFWAVWPFETMLLPIAGQPDILSLDRQQKTDFARALKQLTNLYDKLFNVSFPYSAGIHQAPVSIKDKAYWHWHMSFYPPLLRSASVRKFMVGYEMFAMPQRDITAETVTKRLKNLL